MKIVLTIITKHFSFIFKRCILIFLNEFEWFLWCWMCHVEVYNLSLSFKGNKRSFTDLCFFNTKCFGDHPSYLTCKQVLIGCPLTPIKFNNAQLESNSNLKWIFISQCLLCIFVNGKFLLVDYGGSLEKTNYKLQCEITIWLPNNWNPTCLIRLQWAIKFICCTWLQLANSF